MGKYNYVLYNTQDDEIHYYLQANNIQAAAKQVKDRYPSYAVAPYALTSVTEGRCGKVDWASWHSTHYESDQPEIYKFRSAHGGYRPNAGAKKTLPAGAKRRALAMTDAEYAEVKKLIAQLRK